MPVLLSVEAGLLLWVGRHADSLRHGYGMLCSTYDDAVWHAWLLQRIRHHTDPRPPSDVTLGGCSPGNLAL